MFEKLFNVFRVYERSNDDKYKAFHELHKWLIETMPQKLKNEFNNSVKINPTKNKDGWSVQLTLKDYLWWEAQYNSTLLDMKDITDIETEILQSLAHILDTSVTLDEKNNKELYNIIFDKLAQK